MTSLKPTIANLRRAALKAGGVLEEDEGYRDMRCFQLVAPDNKWWASVRVQCARVEWATGEPLATVSFNRRAFEDAMDILDDGLEDIPESESYLYADD